MRGSVKIASVAGIPIRVHWSFSLIAVLVVLSGTGSSTPGSAVLSYSLWIVALFASVTLHELSHCAVARRRGLEVRDIVLLPIGGVSEISGLPSTPAIERDVAAAGPLASLLLGLGFAAAALATGAHIWPPTLWGGPWLARLAWLNVLLAAFNLVPALPMDGGRVLRALIATRVDELRATRIAVAVAQVVAVGMIAIAFVVNDLWLVVIGLFVLFGATAERRSVATRASFTGLRIGSVTYPDATTVPAGVSVHELAPWLSAYPGRAVPVVDRDGYIGIVAMEDLTGARPWAPVGDVCDRSAPVLDASQPVYPAALEAFSSSHRSQLAVTSGGRLLGVVYDLTLERLARRGLADRRPAPSGPGW